MSVYDELTTDYLLPCYPEMQDRVFQTKSIGKPYFYRYHIDKEGNLFYTGSIDIEVAKTEKPVMVPELFTGSIWFYDFLYDDDCRDMVYFHAIFKEGKLMSITSDSEKNDDIPEEN
jgi:hypothetical protein